MKNKKGLGLNFFIFLIIILILVFGFGLFGTADIIQTFDGRPTATNVKLVSDNPEYSIYRIDFTDRNLDPRRCKEFGDIVFNVKHAVNIPRNQGSVTMGENIYKMNYDLTDIQKNKWFESVSTDFSQFYVTAYSHCGGSVVGQGTFTNQRAYCIAENNEQLSCRIEADGTAPSKTGIAGGFRGFFEVRMYKKGYVEQEYVSQEYQEDDLPPPEAEEQQAQAQEEKLNIFQKFWNWLKNLWDSIF